MKRSPLLRYGVAVLAVAVALLLKLLLGPFIVQDTPFLLAFPAIVVSAWYGGIGPGLLATALAALGIDYFFLDPINSFSGLGMEAVPLGVFVLEGVLVSLLVEGLRSARHRAETSTLEARRRQEELRQSDERYRAVVEQAVEGIYLVDVDTRRIVEANTAYQNLLGYTAGEIVELTLYDVVAHDRESIDLQIQRILEKGAHFIGERRHRRKDGSLVDVEVGSSVISYGDRKVLCVAAHDITERKRAEERLRHSLDSLLALYEAAQIFGSTLEQEEIGSSLLQIMQRMSGLSAAIIDLRDENHQLYVWRTIGPEDLWQSARSTPEAETARSAALESGGHQVFRTRPKRRDSGQAVPEEPSMAGLCLPLRVRDRLIGVLEAYGPEALAEKQTVETLASLANQAASALENARLYEELAEREQQLRDLVRRILTAQEEEQRRVAYEVHDGLTQTAAAAYQHLQEFADYHPPGSAQGREELNEAVELVQQTVSEARRVIADLRPTALDDLGLAAAIRLQVEKLRAEGYQASFEEALGGERLPIALETTLFRVAQEALTNVRKHAKTDRVHVALQRLEGAVRLRVRDWGRGFQPTGATNGGGPGERVGLSSMQERVALVGGNLEVTSEPGAGTSIVAEVPLPAAEENTYHE